MDFPKDFEVQSPWVPVTLTKPIPTKRSLVSRSDWLRSGDVGMDGGPGNSRGPSNWRQAAPASSSQQMPPCSSNGGEMRTQSFNHPTKMSYRTLLALSDPAIMSNMTNLAPILLSQIAGRGGGSQIMPPAFPNQNQLVAPERSSQMMPPASPNQNQLVARERSSQMTPPASPNQNQHAQLIARERSSKMGPSASSNQNQLAQLIARERSRQTMPPASPNQNQLAACGSSQMMPPASPRQNQFFLNGNAVQASSISSSNNRPPQTIAPKTQYGLPIPLLPNLNSVPETHMINTVASKLVVSPETPANLGKNTRTQDFRAVEIIDSVDDTAMSQSNQQKTFCQQTAVEEALRSFSSPGMSSNSVSLQQQEGEINVTPPAETSLQQAEGDNPGVDLNKTPEPKPKRKKHRPKVIREGKAVKTPKPVTPKPVTPMYVRKKKDPSSVENPPEAVGENADPENGSGSKPVSPSLNFDTEDCQARDDRAGPEKFTHNAGPQAVISSSNTKSDVQSAQGWGMGTLENPLGVGNSFDPNSSTNQLHDEYLSIPQTPNPSPQQYSRQEMLRANQIQAEYMRMLNSITSSPLIARREGENMKKLAPRSNHLNTAGNHVMSSEAGQNRSASDKIYDALPKGTKRDHSLVDDAQISGHTRHMHAYNGMNMGNENCDTRRNILCSPEIYKRPRTENMQNEGTSTSYSTFTCNPPRSPKTVQAAQNTSKAFTFADAQRFTTYEKMLDFERTLVCNQAEKTANNRPSQAPSTPLKAVVDDYQRASTPEKPPEFTSNHDIMSIGPRARIEALIASNKSNQKARGRKRKEQVPVDPMSSESKRSEDEADASSATEFSHVQESLSPCSSTKNAKRNNSHFVRDSQGTRKPEGPISQNSQLGTVVPYRDPIEELLGNSSFLNMNAGNKKVTVQQQSALVPYVGGVTKVDLDPESDRVWRLLMGREVEGDAEMGADKEKWWEEERRVFRGRAESFIAPMHLVQDVTGRCESFGQSRDKVSRRHATPTSSSPSGHDTGSRPLSSITPTSTIPPADGTMGTEEQMDEAQSTTPSSFPMTEHFRRMVQRDKDANMVTVLLATHRKDGQLIDERATQSYDEYLRLRERSTQSTLGEAGSSSQPPAHPAPSVDELWMTAVGGLQRGPYYGTGSYDPSASVHTTHPSQESVRAQHERVDHQIMSLRDELLQRITSQPTLQTDDATIIERFDSLERSMAELRDLATLTERNVTALLGSHLAIDDALARLQTTQVQMSQLVEKSTVRMLSVMNTCNARLTALEQIRPPGPPASTSTSTAQTPPPGAMMILPEQWASLISQIRGGALAPPDQ